MKENEEKKTEYESTVRRLTTTECARLQGFTEGHLDCMKGDSAKYHSVGNSWAVNCAYHILARMHIVSGIDKMKYATVCSGVEAHSQAVKDIGDKAIFFSEIEKPQCALLAERYPSVPNMGDFTKIWYDKEKGCITNRKTEDRKENEETDLSKSFYHAPDIEIPFEENSLDLLSGGIPCFTAGAMVLTEKGYTPIEHIRPGDKVVTHLGNLKEVKKVGQKKSNDIVEVVVTSRPPMKMTADHKFYAVAKYHHRHDHYMIIDECDFLPISEIGEKGYLTQLREYHIKSPRIPKVDKLTEEEVMKLAGWYFGDGTVDEESRKKEVMTLYVNKEKAADFERQFGGKVTTETIKTKLMVRKIVANSEVAKWCVKNFGTEEEGKRLPAWVLGAKKENKEAFIEGYLSTRGYVDEKRKNILRVSTSSKSLAYGIADLLGRVSLCEATKKNGQTIWVIQKTENPNRFHEYSNGMYEAVKVRKISKSKPETVYQIMVDEDHSYISNGFCSKNCTDVSVAGKREGMKEGSGTRSSLAFNYQRLIDDLKPTFILYENVPGIFSSNNGKDFIWFLYKLTVAGYTLAWRTLDAQYVMTENHPRAVPQRRRRLWLVGYKGNDWRIPARIVFEKDSKLGDTSPERVVGKGFTTLNPDWNEEEEANKKTTQEKKDNSFDLFSMFGEEPKKEDNHREAHIPEKEDFGTNNSVLDMSLVELQRIMSEYGTVGYCGEVFTGGDKLTCVENISKGLVGTSEEVKSLGEKNDGLFDNDIEEDSQPKEGIAKTSKKSGFIGNAGIMSCGRVVTMQCKEWTSGIQVSPETYEKIKNGAEIKTLLPEAYDGTVCGITDILEYDVDDKYGLSWKACYGIIRRAKGRDKELPAELREALIKIILESAAEVKYQSFYAKKEEDRENAKKCYMEIINEKYPFEQVSIDVVVAEKQKSNEADETNEDEEITEEEKEIQD